VGQEVIINGMKIDTTSIKIDKIGKDGESRVKIDLEFQVTSKEYHDVTTMLYKNDFIVEIPKEKLEVQATIYNYSTSITDLYEEGNVGDFKLVLLENA